MRLTFGMTLLLILIRGLSTNSAQQIEMDIYVEDWGEINDDLPSNAQSAMSENTVARAPS